MTDKTLSLVRPESTTSMAGGVAGEELAEEQNGEEEEADEGEEALVARPLRREGCPQGNAPATPLVVRGMYRRPPRQSPPTGAWRTMTLQRHKS